MKAVVTLFAFLYFSYLAQAQKPLPPEEPADRAEQALVRTEEKKATPPSSQPDPKWFECKSFSNCIKLTGNICERAAAVNKKYQSQYLSYIESRQESDDCTPITSQQIKDDLKKLPSCVDNRCDLIFPK